MHFHIRKKSLLKRVLVWGLRQQGLRQKTICYNIIRECNRRQTQLREKKTEVAEERRANIKMKAGYHFVSRETAQLFRFHRLHRLWVSGLFFQGNKKRRICFPFSLFLWSKFISELLLVTAWGDLLWALHFIGFRLICILAWLHLHIQVEKSMQPGALDLLEHLPSQNACLSF